jgi:hypothetical protein
MSADPYRTNAEPIVIPPMKKNFPHRGVAVAVAFLVVNGVFWWLGWSVRGHEGCRDVVLSVGGLNESCPYAGQSLENHDRYPVCRCPK